MLIETSSATSARFIASARRYRNPRASARITTALCHFVFWMWLCTVFRTCRPCRDAETGLASHRNCISRWRSLQLRQGSEKRYALETRKTSAAHTVCCLGPFQNVGRSMLSTPCFWKFTAKKQRMVKNDMEYTLCQEIHLASCS